jgi:hypothetical protein
LGPTQGYRELVPQWVKWLGLQADHSPLSSAKVNNGGTIPPFPHTYSWQNAKLFKHRDNFTFYGSRDEDFKEYRRKYPKGKNKKQR